MKARVKHLDKTSYLFEVEIPPETVKNTLEEVYREIRKGARIPGYRVGSAPQDLLEKYHSKTAEEEALKILIPEGYSKALQDSKINPVTMPEITDVSFDKSKKLTFKAKVESRPDIKVKNYRGIKVKRKKISVSQSEIDAALKQIREMNAQFVLVEEKRPVAKGDYTICDVEAFIEGKLISKKHENMWIQAEKESSMLGLGENLIGINTGETKEMERELPKDYPDKKYSGKKAMFKINIKEIKIKKLPEIDDELAKDLGKDNLKALEDELRSQLLTRKEKQLKIDLENQILDKLLKDYDMVVPPSMQKRQEEVLVKQAERELLSKGLHKDTVSSKIKEFEPKLKEDAANKIKIYFILDEIASQEKVEVKDADFNNRFEVIAQETNQDLNTVKSYYEKHSLIGGLKEQLMEEKTLDWLLDKASIVDEK